jgi:hypothetical protein
VALLAGIVDGVKRIQKDINAAMNVAAIDHSAAKNWIDDYEEVFLVDTKRKRKLSRKQMVIRVRINQDPLCCLFILILGKNKES